MIRAIYLTQTADGKTSADIKELSEAELPPGDVTVDIDYSTLNYKDGLAITGRGPVVRLWPMVPGIDFAGTVAASDDPHFKPGDRVVTTGWGLGETQWGGLLERARIKSAFLLKLPKGFSTRDAMVMGTAGVTAALSVMALLRHGLRPQQGEILVTGAAGGVGSVAIALLSSLGFHTVASTGRVNESDYLQELGAVRVVDRQTLSAPGKPLQKEVWAGVVDTVGSHTLANACASTKSDGAVAACGLAQGADFPSTVMPFILRGVCLYGINSVYVPNPKREEAWALLAEHVSMARLNAMAVEIGLEEAIRVAADVLAGQTRGRTVVNVKA